MHPLDKMKRKVVCAAVKLPDGNVLIGSRHLGKSMLQQFRNLYKHGNAPNCEEEGVFGFLDQEENFMDRYEALEVAIKAGQVDPVKKEEPKDKLFSEDLY